MNEKNVNPETQKTKKKGGKKVRNIIAAVVAILLILLAGLLCWNMYQKNHSEGAALETAVKAELGQLENKTNEEIEAELNRVIGENEMAISINMAPVFVDGTSEGSLQIENSPANHHPQEIVITLNETGEEIYRSGLLMPNYHIQNDKLAVDLDAGTYECTALFTAYDLDIAEKPTQVGTSAAKIEITVIS